MLLARQSDAQDQSSALSHDLELTGFSTALVLVGCKVIDSFPDGHDSWTYVGVLVSGIDLLYRIPEFETPKWNYYLNEYITCDLLGVGIGIAVELIFPPHSSQTSSANMDIEVYPREKDGRLVLATFY
jgi:hypothetical protein